MLLFMTLVVVLTVSLMYLTIGCVAVVVVDHVVDRGVVVVGIGTRDRGVLGCVVAGTCCGIVVVIYMVIVYVICLCWYIW